MLEGIVTFLFSAQAALKLTILLLSFWSDGITGLFHHTWLIEGIFKQLGLGITK
jgi:hypothetical protein